MVALEVGINLDLHNGDAFNNIAIETCLSAAKTKKYWRQVSTNRRETLRASKPVHDHD
jgi:hypothetical protein